MMWGGWCRGFFKTDSCLLLTTSIRYLAALLKERRTMLSTSRFCVHSGIERGVGKGGIRCQRTMLSGSDCWCTYDAQPPAAEACRKARSHESNRSVIHNTPLKYVLVKHFKRFDRNEGLSVSEMSLMWVWFNWYLCSISPLSLITERSLAWSKTETLAHSPFFSSSAFQICARLYKIPWVFLLTLTLKGRFPFSSGNYLRVLLINP